MISITFRANTLMRFSTLSLMVLLAKLVLPMVFEYATVAMISKLIPIDYNKLEQCIKADDRMFKESSEHSCLPSWCNGIAGQILARVIGYTATLNKSTKEVFESSLNSYLEEKHLNVLLSCKQLCLCHGVYGVASVLNYLKDNSKQKKSFLIYI